MTTEESREEGIKKVNGIMQYFGITMSVLYIVISLLLVFTDIFGNVDWNTRLVFGGILFSYGLFRLYRVFNIRK